jgi:hypothetical protein
MTMTLMRLCPSLMAILSRLVEVDSASVVEMWLKSVSIGQKYRKKKIGRTIRENPVVSRMTTISHCSRKKSATVIVRIEFLL